MSPEGIPASATIAVTMVDRIPILKPCARSFFSEQAKEFSRLVKSLRRKKQFFLVVDLSECDYISSEGLGIIAACRRWCEEKRRGAMGVVLPPDTDSEVVNLFDITGLSRSIGSALQRSVRDAIAYLKNFYEIR